MAINESEFARGRTISEILGADLSEAARAGASEDDLRFGIECIIVSAIRRQKTDVDKLRVAGGFAEVLAKCVSEFCKEPI